MSYDIIDTASKGVLFCNKHIQKIEMNIQLAQEKGDIQTIAKLEGHLVAWVEQLQHYQRMAHQHAETQKDVATELEKSKRIRFKA